MATFNVFVEGGEEFARYVARLQNVVGDQPLVITELGLDSRRHGLDNLTPILWFKIGNRTNEAGGGSSGIQWQSCGARIRSFGKASPNASDVTTPRSHSAARVMPSFNPGTAAGYST